METKRLTLFAGHYGSGKTNIAVNYAFRLAKEGKRVCIADLDIVNPYFRTKDSEAELKELGIRLISPRYANTNVDLPALPAESYRLVQDKNVYGIMDIGGDDRGAYALGRFVDAIKAENNYEMVFVANCYRPLTKTVDDTIEIVAQVNGRIKAKLNIAADADQADVIALAKAEPKVQESIAGMNIVKEIYVRGKLVNIVVKP